MIGVDFGKDARQFRVAAHRSMGRPGAGAADAGREIPSVPHLRAHC